MLQQHLPLRLAWSTLERSASAKLIGARRRGMCAALGVGMCKNLPQRPCHQ
jgi:hypothetical protein